jgi:pyridoxamine 5'-phosphate oxidase
VARRDEPRETELGGALPAEPLRLLHAWLEEAFAKGVQQNPHAVTLATTDPDGRPSARVVLCKEIDVEEGWILFYTNLRSRKGQALERSPYAAVVFHWDALGRQARLEGPVTLVSEEEADAYFASRPLNARIAAIASEQSEPIESRESLLRRFDEVASSLGIPPGAEDASVPRPKHWGGYRVWAERVELWVSRPDRLHDRGEWTRRLRANRGRFVGGPWKAARLQP